MDKPVCAQPQKKKMPRRFKNAALALYCAVFIWLSGNSVTDALSDMPAPSESVLSSGVSFKQEIPAQTEFETQQFYQPQMHHVADEPVLTPMKYQLECFVSGGAYTYKTLETDIERMAQNYTPLVSYESIGQSVNGKDIFALTIGGGKTHILITAGVHARETANTPMLMQALFDFLYAYAEGEYGDILKNVTLIAVPLVNPDGYDECLTQHNAVKKTNANGVDINRNFPCKYWGSKKKKPGNGYPGPYAGSEPETQAVMALFDRYAFALAADIHSRGRYVICMKGGFTADDITTHEGPEALNDTSLALASCLLEDIRYDLVKERKVKTGEEGTLTDYAFSRGVPTVTFETLRYKKNRLPDTQEIKKEYAYFNWPFALYKLAGFALARDCGETGLCASVRK